MIETLLGGLLGGAFRLAPEILKWLDRKGERGHELAMQDKALEFEKLRGATRMAEINAAADAAWNSGAVEALREAVARGLGVGAVSEAEFIADPRFVPIRIDGDPATTSTYLYYARERSRSLLIQSFLQAQRITPQSEPPA